MLAEVPTHSPARVTADSRYVLFLNGVEVSRGPARAAPPRLCFEELDLAPRLRNGENVLAALVRYYGNPVPWWRPFGRGGQLGFGSFCFEAPAIGIFSDSSWRARPAPYQRVTPVPYLQPHTEILDGGLVPGQWQEPGMDDRAWPPAVELLAGPLMNDPAQALNDPFYVIEASHIAPLTADPMELSLVGSGTGRPTPTDVLTAPSPAQPGEMERHLTYDAGRLVLATPWLEVSGNRGDAVDVFVGEDLRPDGRAETAPRCYALRYQLMGGGPERSRASNRSGSAT